MDVERMQILEMISNGTITVEEAAKLIEALDEADEMTADETSPEESAFEEQAGETELSSDVEGAVSGAMPPLEVGPPQTESQEPFEASFPSPPMGFKKWQAFWLIPLTAGILITVVSGLLLYAGSQADWHGFWMFCIWMPLLFGIVVLLLGAMSRTARWLHVRVNTGQDEWPRRVAISLPLPLRTSAWVIRIFGHYIPGLDDIPVPIHEAIQALEESLTPDDPLYVKVDDSGGEKVEVFIG